MHVAAWLRPCRTSPKKAAPPQRVLDGAPRQHARHGPFGPTAPRGHRPAAGRAPTNVILCTKPRPPRPPRPPPRLLMCQQSCTRADLLLDEDGAPRRRSTESGERNTVRERARDPAPRRRATALRAMAVSARRASQRTGFGACCRVGASAQRTRWRSFLARPSPRRDVARSPARPPATARYV